MSKLVKELVVDMTNPPQSKPTLGSVSLVQYAKWPRLGKVKTRLARDVGNEQALRAHQALTQNVNDNLAVLASRLEQGQLILAFDHLPDTEQLSSPSAFSALRADAFQLQVGESLGDKMATTFTSLLSSCEKVVIVGSDCPSADSDYIEAALEALNDVDIVFGPADDGGYVLIAAKVFDKQIFNGVEWGAELVLQQTLENIQQSGLTYRLLEERWDVDDMAGYERWLNLVAH